MLAACDSLVPASVPPHIRNTPGASVVVTDELFDAGSFRLEFPRSWSVVMTSQATYKRIQAYFLAPDGGSVFLQHVDSMDEETDEYLLLPNGVILKVSIEAADGTSPLFSAQAQRLISSIRS